MTDQNSTQAVVFPADVLEMIAREKEEAKKRQMRVQYMPAEERGPDGMYPVNVARCIVPSGAANVRRHDAGDYTRHRRR